MKSRRVTGASLLTSSIPIGSGEIAAGRLSDAHLEQALNAVRRDGFVILEDVVATDHIERLRREMDARAAPLRESESWAGAGAVRGNLEQEPPTTAPYVFADVLCNPLVCQITRGVLGARVVHSLYTCNTVCPESDAQRVHRDGGIHRLRMRRWLPWFRALHPTPRLIVNVPLNDFTERNGSTELWPGTHVERTVTKWAGDLALAERTRIAPPWPAVARRGSVIIRDALLWHRGTCNRSDELRHMLGMIHDVPWRRRGEPMRFNRSSKPVLRGSELDHHVVFVDGSAAV